MDGFAQALGRCARHLGLQLVERDSQIVRHMNSGNKLAQVFESLRGLLQVCTGGQETLKLARQFGIVGKPLGNAGLLFAGAAVGIMVRGMV